MPNQYVGDKIYAALRGEFPPNQRGLVKTARPHPRPMQRNRRNDDVIPPLGQMADKLLRNHAGQADLAAIFKPERDLCRQVIIFYRGANAVVLGWFGQACCAICLIPPVIFERRCATITPWRRKKLQLLPAIYAEWSTSGRYRATAWATFGQRPIERSMENLAADCHEDLSDKAGVCTRPK